MGETPLQSTPIAISAFTAEELETRGMGDVTALVDYVPGLQISDVNGYAQLYLRGVGSNNVFIGSDPSTTVHVDGVYLARPIAYFVDFLDVERVEVLRGPQGTLYGRNSVGGTVNIISRRPTREPTGQIQLTGGTYDELGFKGYVSGPIGSTGLLGSLSVSRARRHGFFDNISEGGDLVDQDAFGARGQIYAPLGDRADVTVRADFHHSDEATAGASKLLEPIGVPLDDSILGDYRKVSVNAPNSLEIRTYGVSADINFDISDRATIRSLTAYRSLKSDNVTDADASSLDTTRSLFDLRQDQFSEEITLNARFDRLSFVAGVYYFRETDREPANVILPLFGLTHFQRPHLTAESHAVFAQAEYRFNDVLSGIVGLRYTDEDKHYRLTDFWTFSGSLDPEEGILAPKLVGVPGFSDPFEVDSTKSNSAVTPKFGLNYQPSEDLLLYVSATRGFKSGGFDFGATSQEQQTRGYGPEYLWSYEIGMKSDWLDNRLRANFSAFFYDYKDLQVTVYTPPASGFTQNAATAEVKGVEAEIIGAPAESIRLFASIAYLDARYKDYPEAQVKAFGPFDASGKRLNDAPRWTFTAGGAWTRRLTGGSALTMGVDFHYRTTQYFSPANDGVNGATGYPAQQGPVGLLNARLGWSSADGVWDAILIGRNLLDREYITMAADYGGPALTTVIGRPGAPRTVSLQVTRRF